MEQLTKEQVQKKVLKNGEPLGMNLFEWDKKTNTFSSEENYLVLDFNFVNGCTFKTGSDCTFKTGSGCTFDTGYGCTFKTGSDCTFDTDSDCTFDTGYGCTFKTGSDCTFKTGSDCTFDTDYDCTFKTGSGCTFKTGSGCTFETGSDYTSCVVVRRDIFEIIELKEKQTIKLNEWGVKGFTVIENKLDIEEMTMDEVCKALGKTIKIKK
jgi:hypothetical protein